MAITVTPNMEDISLCTLTTGWSAGGTNTDFPLEGTTCLGIQIKNTLGALVTYQPYTTVSSVSRSRSGGVATIVSGTHSMSVGQNFTMRLMAGVGYNGNWTVLEVVSTTSFRYTNAGSDEGVTADVAGRSIRALDFTGNKHLYAWMLVTGVVETKANGGYQLYMETDSTNHKTWYVGGNDTVPGGWTCFVVDPDSTPTTPVGTLVKTHITKIGVRFYTISSIAGTTFNCFWDAIRMGTGITVTSGAADAITLAAIYAYCNDTTTRRWGVVTVGTGNTYIIQGKIIFAGTGAEIIDFVDKNQIILFPDNAFVSDTFYGIQVLRGSGVVNFVLGEKIGTAGLNGNVLKSVGTKRFSFDASNANNNKIQLYGNTFANAGVISLPPVGADNEVLNCIFGACSEMLASTCKVRDSNFVSSPARAMRISSVSHDVKDSNFINCQTAIHHDIGGPEGAHVEYDYDNLKFVGGTYHIENSAVTPNFYIDIDRLNGSNPDVAKILNSGGGSTTLLPISLTLKMVVTNEAGQPIVGALAYIDDNDQTPFILNTTTDAFGIAENTSYIGGPVSGSRWRVRKYGYKAFKQLVDISTSSITLYVTLVVDPQQT